MNEKIRLLASDVGISVEYLTNTKQILLLEKFAQLIVKECADIAEKWYSDYPSDDRLVSDAVKQHFGVRE